MHSRDYLKKQFEQIGKAIAQSLANVLKVKFDTIEKRQHLIKNLDDEVVKILSLNITDFTAQVEKLPAEALQNLSLLLIEISTTEDSHQDKIQLINTILSNKHKTLDFNHYLRNS